MFHSPGFTPSADDVLALVGDGVIATDEAGRILIFSQAAESMFGYEAAEALGRSVEMLMPPVHRDGHAEDVRRFARDAAPRQRLMGRRREVVGLRRDGSTFPIEATLSRREIDGRTVLTVVVRDITDRKRIEAELKTRSEALERSERRLRLALRGGRMGVWEWDPVACELLLDAAARRIWRLPEELRLTREEAFRRVHPDDIGALRAAIAEAERTGADYRSEYRIRDDEGGVRWLAEKGSVLPVDPESGAGKPGMLGVVFDVTERRALDEQRDLLAAEVEHRMKNTLGLVNAIVGLSAGSADSVDGYRRALQGRLGALADTQRHLDGGGIGATLSDMLLSELEPYRAGEGGNVVLDGPMVALPDALATSLRLAVHELATNAAKYGALSRPGGRLAVCWRIEGADGARRLVLDWRESGGPEVAPPRRRGFGSTVIESTLAQSLRGEVDLDYDPAGLRCRIVLPLEAG
ncbi:PAS domain S-box protein [Salinarimonas sp.]|uniref:sensor histidine kinase n=1 Tax=Salinarimonas sp. TaxID=2766526 RepID=UPI0032D8DF2D